MENKNVLVVFGGKSFEHDISIITTVIMMKNYTGGKYKLLPVYISKDNQWFFFTGEKLEVGLFKDFETTYRQKGFVKAFLKNQSKFLFYKKGIFEKSLPVYSVLNCCHGGAGENGDLNAIFGYNNIPISSGDVCAMGVSMNKLYTKFVLNGLKINCVKYVAIERDKYQSFKGKMLKEVENLGFPVIIKPSMLGSSIGISIANNIKELEEALNLAFEFDNEILVESAILNGMKEYNVACLKTKNGIVVSEIDYACRSDKILSFKDKYIGNNNTDGKKIAGGTKKCGGYLTIKKDFPAKVSDKLRNMLREMSLEVYEKLNLRGPVRIDFLVDKRGKVYLNELNAVPGSLAYYFFVPSIFKTLSQYIDNIIDYSIYENDKNKVLKKEYITNLIK